MKLRSKLASLALVSLTALTSLSVVQSSAVAQLEAKRPIPVSGAQAKPDIPAGSMDNASPALRPLGSTKLQKLDATGKPVGKGGVTPLGGYDTSVDFSTFYKYCQGNLVYTTVRNYSTVTKYFQVVLSANGSTRTFYTSVPAGGTAYPTWYGVTGTFYAYLYVWNGAAYAYDEYKYDTNTCSVSVTWTVSASYPGYVLMTAKNNGTNYASLESNELAPYPGAGTYTGYHWDYPAAYGGTISRYYYVGTGLRFGIYANLYGALGYSPWYRYGVL